MTERPPVEPLREAIEKLPRWTKGMDAVGGEWVRLDAVRALASPAAHTALCAANGGGDPRCVACVGTSAAAPRPEGLTVERLADAFRDGGARLHENTWHVHDDDLGAIVVRLSATSEET